MQTALPPTSTHWIKPGPQVIEGQFSHGGGSTGGRCSTQAPIPANASSTICFTLSGQRGQFCIITLIFPPSVPGKSTLKSLLQPVFESRRSSINFFSLLL